VPLCAALPTVAREGLAGEEERRAGEFEQREAEVFDGLIQGLRRRECERDFGVDDRIDRQSMNPGLRAQLGNRPLEPVRVVLQYIDQHIAVDQKHQSSPRSSAINSSVRHLISALPRALSNLSGARGLPAATLRITTSPSSLTAKSTELPGDRPSESRMCFGMVTCPLIVIVVGIWRPLGITM